MPPAGFEVQFELQSRAAARFGDASDDLARALGEMRTSLASVAGMCGDDEHGRAFAAHWEPKAEELTAALAGAAGSIAELSARVEAMAQGYARCEDVNERACRGQIEAPA